MDGRSWLEAQAHAHGFHVARTAVVGPTPFASVFRAWLEAGRHADMAWLERQSETRLDPRNRMPEARTALVLAVLHHHRRPPDPGGRAGLVARYAWGRDYHRLVGNRVQRLAASIRAAGHRAWGSVDTGPVLERAWAAAAGLGFGGKSTVQFLPGRTSYLFLAVLFTDVEAEPDAPTTRDHCGTCTRCLDACPTGAFVGPRSLNSGRCISYWTIEAKGLAPAALRPGFGRWVFGCDVCQEVCPHNHDPDDPDEDDLRPRHAWLDLDLVLATPDDALADRFLGTPLRRAGAVGLKRNALVALGNLGDDGAVEGIERHARRHGDPVVRAAAAWALRRLGADPGPDDHPLVRAELAP